MASLAVCLVFDLSDRDSPGTHTDRSNGCDPRAISETLAHRYSHHPQDRLDGLAVDCGDWWFNLRPSNTEPLLRLNLEARRAAECARRLAEVRAVIERGA